METVYTFPKELLYLADQQQYARGMLPDDDYGGIRESLVIEWALRDAAARLNQQKP